MKVSVKVSESLSEGQSLELLLSKVCGVHFDEHVCMLHDWISYVTDFLSLAAESAPSREDYEIVDRYEMVSGIYSIEVCCVCFL